MRINNIVFMLIWLKILINLTSHFLLMFTQCLPLHQKQ